MLHPAQGFPLKRLRFFFIKKIYFSPFFVTITCVPLSRKKLTFTKCADL